ncbi:MAG: PucR family transcriptional regulator [Acidimicrobiales bacterium]
MAADKATRHAQDAQTSGAETAPPGGAAAASSGPPALPGPQLVGTGGPTVATLAAETLADLPRLTERLVRRAVEVEEPYRSIPIEEFSWRASENLRRALTDLAEQRPITVESQRRTARRRAEEGVPLASVLHAFRLGFTVIWEAMMDRARASGDEAMRALLDGTSVVWSVIDTHSDVVTVEYQATLAELARRDEQRRRLLVDALFDGRLAEWQSLHGSTRELGLPSRGPYLAVAAETTEPGTEALPGIERELARHGFPSVWRLRSDEQAGVVALGRRGPGAVAALRELLGRRATARVGVSGEFQDTSETARALGSATLGRACLRPGEVGVAMADEDVLTALAVGSPELSARIARTVLGPLGTLRDAERRRLLATLETWFSTDGGVGATSEALGCHRNTVRNRLARIERLSRRSLGDPRGACELYLAMRVAQFLDLDLTAVGG